MPTSRPALSYDIFVAPSKLASPHGPGPVRRHDEPLSRLGQPPAIPDPWLRTENPAAKPIVMRRGRIIQAA